MKGDLHVQFRENAGVKFPCVTRSGCEKTPFLITTFQKHFTKKITIQLDSICG